jgi:CheY-like chemotaxis protein
MQATTNSAAQRKVLIVDDSRAILAILRRVVQQVGGPAVDIRSVTHAQEALDMVDSFQPDLIITDWHMPGVTGIEMLQTLRQTGHGDVRVGFVTAETTPARLAEAHSNGADFVVNKPFQDAELVDAIRLSLKGAAGAKPARPRGEGPLRAEVIERLLKVALKQLPFTLSTCEPMLPQTLTPFLLRCHYGQGSDERPSVVGLLDFGALCVIGAGAGANSAELAAAAIDKGRPDPEVVQRATTFMRIASKLIQGHSEAQPFRMLRAQVVSRGVGELDELLTQASERTDVRVSVKGCGDAHITYLKVPQ